MESKQVIIAEGRVDFSDLIAHRLCHSVPIQQAYFKQSEPWQSPSPTCSGHTMTPSRNKGEMAVPTDSIEHSPDQ
jgi:hypothetical protein